MRSEEMWLFKKDEWIAMWARERAFTLPAMKKLTTKWVSELTEEHVFANFYNWIFEYLKPPGGTMLSGDSALTAWRITGINKKWSWFSDWASFIAVGNKTVGKDTWKQMPTFIQKVGTNLKSYDEMDFWPPMFDDFIAFLKSKGPKS